MSHNEFTVSEIGDSVNSAPQLRRKDLIIAIAFVLIALIAFGLGRLSVLWETKVPVTLEISR